MKKILIVDDAPDSRLILKSMLRNYDVDVVEACDGNEGWKKIVAEQPDLVLLDLHMPEKDGFTILEDLEEEWMGIPVIVVSGDTQDETIDACNYYGAKAFLKKPVILEEFKEAIKVLPL
ncbi:PleD family two-component system response regulator [Carboxylicivirga sp. M1479]|uniref:response regulator n=1 Tax=Carboxylicivirga sp. M1479 TaxID=2594476 RepID=UPI0011778E35|nr:response regulator [Carboxylicivirga sp. M1479]TRX71811.1 response regulator [Carboxylicivirga sp. M1479]